MAYMEQIKRERMAPFYIISYNDSVCYSLERSYR